MAPVIIVITPGAIVALAILFAAVLVLRAALRKRPARHIPTWHGLHHD